MTNDINMKEEEELLDGQAEGEGEGGEEDVDLYDDVLSLSVEKHDVEDHEDLQISISPEPNQGVNNISRVQTGGNQNHNDSRGERDREHQEFYKDSVLPHRRHQVCVGNLTWWTSDKDMQEVMYEIGVHDFIDVKFYDNRANGQSKGYCVVTVGSDASLKIIHEKLSKKDMHGQFPVVTHPTKQNLNQFEAQSKNRPSPSGQGMGNGGGRGFDGTGNGNMGGMNMMRGPMPIGGSHGMGMGMGYGGGPGQRMMGGPPGHGPGPMHGNRGMPPMGTGGPRMPMMMHGGPPGPMGRGPLTPGESHGMMGPQHHGGQSGYGPPQPQRQMPPQNSMPMPPMPGGPRMPVMMHGGPPGPGPMSMGRGHMQPGMMDPRGPPPRQEWERPPMNNYPPHGPGPMPMPLNRPPDIRGQGNFQPTQIPGGGPGQLQPNPAPHMNPAFFGSQPGPGPGPTGVGSFNSPEPQLGTYHPPAMSEVEFDEVMSRNRTVSSSAISRAVSDAATGDFASAIETLVTAISLIKQSKVAHDDRCKILVSSLQDTLHGIEGKSYGGSARRDRSRSPRDRHRRSRRERSRSRESYRDRSRERDRHYDYLHPHPHEERPRTSREREYRERERPREERSHYDERYRERERERDKDRPPRTDRDRELERERESVRERGPRH